jgi:hypothetical protein
MIDSTTVWDLGACVAAQIKDAGRLNSPSAIQPTEDAEMRG